MGTASIAYPLWACIGASAIVIAGSAAGLRLRAWTVGLSENVRRLAFLLGIAPWNVVSLGLLMSLGVADQLEQVKAVDNSAWTPEMQLAARQLVEVELSLRTEQVLLVRVALTSGVAMVVGIILTALHRHASWTGYSGALLLATATAGFVFIIGRSSGLASALVDGFSHLGLM